MLAAYLRLPRLQQFASGQSREATAVGEQLPELVRRGVHSAAVTSRRERGAAGDRKTASGRDTDTMSKPG